DRALQAPLGQLAPYARGAPAKLGESMKAEIIGVISVVEKAQIRQMVEHLLDVARAGERCQLLAELGPAVRTPGEQPSGPRHQLLVKLGLHSDCSRGLAAPAGLSGADCLLGTTSAVLGVDRGEPAVGVFAGSFHVREELLLDLFRDRSSRP